MTAVASSEVKKDLTIEFPNVKNKGGEVLVVVARSKGWIWREIGGNQDGMPTLDDGSIGGTGAQQSCVPPSK